VVTAGGVFDRREELVETLRQSPEAVLAERKVDGEKVLSSRWQLVTIQAAMPWLQSYSLSGVWRLLQRYGLKLRTARVQQYSPDPDYEQKAAHLVHCLQQTAQNPAQIVFLFMDEMGYYGWPEPGQVWTEAVPAPAPKTDHQQAKQQLWRLIGVLNALSGQVDYLDNYIVGRAKVIEMYQHISQRYDWASRIYVAQDNWSIHKHDEVMTALAQLPRIEPVWLPTYAPWLNPIEKLWRWLRQEVLKMHRLAAQWSELRQRVNTFLDQFADGSSDLLRYVGLAGDGKLATAIQTA
jgi:transposase